MKTITAVNEEPNHFC